MVPSTSTVVRQPRNAEPFAPFPKIVRHVTHVRTNRPDEVTTSLVARCGFERRSVKPREPLHESDGIRRRCVPPRVALARWIPIEVRTPPGVVALACSASGIEPLFRRTSDRINSTKSISSSDLEFKEIHRFIVGPSHQCVGADPWRRAFFATDLATAKKMVVRLRNTPPLVRCHP